MTRKSTPSTTYMVAWPALGVVKVGWSNGGRWLTFIPRGAIQVALIEFEEFWDGNFFEERVLGDLRVTAPAAFRNGAEAKPYLGTNGGGWRECFKITIPDALAVLRAQVQAIPPGVPSNARYATLPTQLTNGD